MASRRPAGKKPCNAPAARADGNVVVVAFGARRSLGRMSVRPVPRGRLSGRGRGEMAAAQGGWTGSQQEAIRMLRLMDAVERGRGMRLDPQGRWVLAGMEDLIRRYAAFLESKGG